MKNHQKKILENFDKSLEFSDWCSSCQGKCCKGHIYDGIAGYAILHALLTNQIELKHRKGLFILDIPDDQLENLTKSWLYVPDHKSWVRNMTISTGNPPRWQILMLPSSADNCQWLGEKGCHYPALRPIECRLYPYCYYCGDFLIRTEPLNCPHADQLATETMQKKIREITESYTEYCNRWQNAYAHDLIVLQKKLQIPVYRIPDELPPKAICPTVHEWIQNGMK